MEYYIPNDRFRNADFGFDLDQPITKFPVRNFGDVAEIEKAGKAEGDEKPLVAPDVIEVVITDEVVYDEELELEVTGQLFNGNLEAIYYAARWYYYSGIRHQSRNEYRAALKAYSQSMMLEIRLTSSVLTDNSAIRSYILYNMALCYATQENHEMVLKCNKECARLNPTLPQVHNNMGIFAYFYANIERGGKFYHNFLRRAVRAWRKAIALEPSKYVNQGRWADAYEALVAAIHPENPEEM